MHLQADRDEGPWGGGITWSDKSEQKSPLLRGPPTGPRGTTTPTTTTTPPPTPPPPPTKQCVRQISGCCGVAPTLGEGASPKCKNLSGRGGPLPSLALKRAQRSCTGSLCTYKEGARWDQGGTVARGQCLNGGETEGGGGGVSIASQLPANTSIGVRV